MKLALGLPTYGHLCLEQFNIALSRAQLSPLIPEYVEELRISDSLVSRARNNIAHIFLKGSCDSLLFIDSDIIFTPEHIRRAIDHNKPIVCGAYALKNPGAPSWVACGLIDEPPDANGLQKMRHCGTGFMLIQREVFQKMIPTFPEIMYLDKERDESLTPDVEHHDFFSVGVVDRHLLSEDWYFCNRARKLGYDIFLDTKIILGHIGLVQYPIDYSLAPPADGKT